MPVFRRQHRGHFVTIVSTAGLKIVPQQAVYAATKNAVRTISKGLRQVGSEIRVAAISPGFIRTEFANSMTDPDIRAKTLAARDAMAITPDAIARAIAFAIEEPDDVDINEIVIRPTAQP